MSALLIIVLTDEDHLGRAIERTLSRTPTPSGLGPLSCLRMTYCQQHFFLSAEIIQESRLFVLELMRSYGGSRRAEGLVAALRLHARHGKPSLIVSSYALAPAVASPWYWDLGSPDALGQRIASLVEYDTGLPAFDVSPVEKLFASSLVLPLQH